MFGNNYVLLCCEFRLEKYLLVYIYLIKSWQVMTPTFSYFVLVMMVMHICLCPLEGALSIVAYTRALRLQCFRGSLQ